MIGLNPTLVDCRLFSPKNLEITDHYKHIHFYVNNLIITHLYTWKNGGTIFLLIFFLLSRSDRCVMVSLCVFLFNGRMTYNTQVPMAPFISACRLLRVDFMNMMKSNTENRRSVTNAKPRCLSFGLRQETNKFKSVEQWRFSFMVELLNGIMCHKFDIEPRPVKKNWLKGLPVSS